MEMPKTKQQALDHVLALEANIQVLAKENSLATLEHKLKLRQDALEYLFEHFTDDITQADVAKLKDIYAASQTMLENMELNKQEKSEEIIKYKNTGKRIRLYSDIAQQK